jgi:hypothetical protein
VISLLRQRQMGMAALRGQLVEHIRRQVREGTMLAQELRVVRLCNMGRALGVMGKDRHIRSRLGGRDGGNSSGETDSQGNA